MRALTAAVLVFAVAAWPQTADSATKRGTAKRDVVRGTRQADVLHGLAGNDLLFGRQGTDRLHGGAGRDLLRGGTGADRLSGGAGADQLHGQAGNDRLAGGKGPDRLYGGKGNDRIYGGPGTDRIFCGPGTDTVIDGSGDRLAADCEQKPKDDDEGWSWSDVLLILALLAVIAAALVFAFRQALKIRADPRRTGPPSADDDEPHKLWTWLPYSLPFPALGIIAVTGYTLNVANAAALSVGLLVAGAAFLVGGLFGFIFGIPKSLTDGTTPRKFQSNTSLERLSEWLTTIIVGLTLIQLGELIDQMQRLANFLKPSFGDRPSSTAFAIATLMLFGISGFFTLYVATRLYVGRAFARAETPSKEVTGLVKDEVVDPMLAAFKLTAKEPTKPAS